MEKDNVKKAFETLYKETLWWKPLDTWAINNIFKNITIKEPIIIKNDKFILKGGQWGPSFGSSCGFEVSYSENKEEIDKFIRDVTNNDCSGVFLSQNTGIVGKENFQMDIHNKNILIYIHCVNYDITKINLAINTIDVLYDKIIKINVFLLIKSYNIMNN